MIESNFNKTIVLFVNNSDNQPITFEEFRTQTQERGFARSGGIVGAGLLYLLSNNNNFNFLELNI